LKILIVVPTYYPAFQFGGPIFQIHYLAKNLIKNKILVTVCTTDKGNKTSVNSKIKKTVEGVEVFYFRRLFPKFYFSISMISFLLRNINKYELVHIHSIFNFPSAVSLIFSALFKKKIILSPRGILDEDLIKSKNAILKKFWLYLFKYILSRKVEVIHATTELEKKKIKFYFKNSNIKVIPNGFDLNSFLKKNLKNNLNKKYNKYFKKKTNLLYLGRVEKKKNIDLILKSISKAKLPNFTFNVVGSGDEKYLKYLCNLCCKLNLNENVNFIDHLDNVSKIYFYQNSSHLLLPSKSENFANVVLESIFFGKSVLISEEVGLKDFVKKNNFGIICDSKKTFEKELKYLIKDKNIISNTKKYGKKSVIKNFDWNKIIYQYIKMYKSQLQNI
jgi:glycosyltransferase involved in cell wall biosynthesis